MIEQVQFGGRPQRVGRMIVTEGDNVTIGLGVTATDVAELDGATAVVWTNLTLPTLPIFRRSR